MYTNYVTGHIFTLGCVRFRGNRERKSVKRDFSSGRALLGKKSVTTVPLRESVQDHFHMEGRVMGGR